MRLMILGATIETDRVRAAIAAARHAGFTVCDWTEGRTATSVDSHYTDAEADAIAATLHTEILDADVVWWLVPPCLSQSAIEHDRAKQLGKRIVSSGPESSRTRGLYRAEASTHFQSDLAALAWIVGNR